eukprot:gene40041-9275_t
MRARDRLTARDAHPMGQCASVRGRPPPSDERRRAEEELYEQSKGMEQPAAGDDVVSQIQWLWKQKKDGELTEEEFTAAKRKLLSTTTREQAGAEAG